MTEHQELLPDEALEVAAEEESAAEELPAEDAAPSAAAQKAAETHESVVESRGEGLTRVLETMQTEAITLAALSPEGQLNFEKVQELAAIIPVEVLYQIEDVRPGALLDLFADKINDKTYLFGFQDKQGRRNVEAESLIGLNYFFKNRPEVRRVKATSPEGVEEVGDRGDSLKGNFYEGDEYVEVMAGYEVEILQVAKDDGPKLKKMERKREKAMKAYETVQTEPERFSGFTTMLSNGKYDDINTSHVEGETQEQRLTREIIERSADAGVDPYLVMSLLKAENGDNGKHFGVMLGEEAANFETQLDWALKIIQQRELTFKQNGGDVDKKGRYSEEFLIYFSETYSPPDENPNHFGNLYQNYALYSGFKPMEPEKLTKTKEKSRKEPTHKRPRTSAERKKRPTIEDILPDEAYREKVKSYLSTLEGGARIAEAARILADKTHPLYKAGPWNTAPCCWDWVNKVYAISGYNWFERGHQKEHFYYNHPNKKLGQHANRSQVQDLQPGDWVYLHVAIISGGGGKKGDHSLIFLRWLDKENLVAEFASEPKLRDTPHAKIEVRRLAGDGPVGKSGGKDYFPLIKRTSPGKKCGY